MSRSADAFAGLPLIHGRVPIASRAPENGRWQHFRENFAPMPTLTLKPARKAVTAYYDSLAIFARLGIKYETAVRSPPAKERCHTPMPR